MRGARPEGIPSWSFERSRNEADDPASFAGVKPKLLRRAREQKAYAAELANQGLSLMTKSGQKDLQKAVNRHSESLERAIKVAPGVKPFFDKELAAILNAK